MSLWRPPRTNGERAMRAIRSMQNGSIDGRVVSAYPVKPDVVEEEDYDTWEEGIDDATDGSGDGTTDDDSIKPWTDYFSIKGVYPVHDFALTKTPWVQEKMPNEVKSYASVHLYWNGVFQPDLSYSLENSVITLLDEGQRMRAGDVITVKYFYDQDTGGEVDPNMFRMQCWFDRHDTTPVDRPGYNIFWAGVLEASKTGSNTGTITTTAGRYYSLQTSGGWLSRFRVPRNTTIPTGDDVAGITWRVSFDAGATIIIDSPASGYDDFFVRGNDFGTIVCHKTCCGFEVGGDGCSCGSAELPLLRYDNTVGPFNPSFGPIGGTVFCTGDAGIQLAKHLNARNKPGDDYGYIVKREMPLYPGPVPYNAGCTYAGGAANAEDTIYGKHSHEKATYNVKIGVTATVIRK